MVKKGQTTICINHGILRQARKLAVDEHRSFSSLVESCLVRAISRHERLREIDMELDKEEARHRRRVFTDAEPAPKSKTKAGAKPKPAARKKK